MVKINGIFTCNNGCQKQLVLIQRGFFPLKLRLPILKMFYEGNECELIRGTVRRIIHHPGRRKLVLSTY